MGNLCGSVFQTISDLFSQGINFSHMGEVIRKAFKTVEGGPSDQINGIRWVTGTAIAICFLFSFANPAHERRARDIVATRFPHLFVAVSHEVDPAFREYERTVVTSFDAYVKPVIDRYLRRRGAAPPRPPGGAGRGP